jgi:hypothetical protein
MDSAGEVFRSAKRGNSHRRSRMPLVAVFIASGAAFTGGLGLAIALLFRA